MSASCFYCRRGMHDSCISGEQPCPCCVPCSGCCSTCKGTGGSNDVETNGKCWDCYGTGHLGC